MAKFYVIEYDRVWADAFEKEATYLKDALGDKCEKVLHIGSTAVQGMAARPIVDIMLVASDTDAVSEKLKTLSAAGYSLDEAVSDSAKYVLKKEATDGDDMGCSYCLYIVGAESDDVKAAVEFVDMLKNDPFKARNFSEAKKKLAEEFPDDEESYLKGKEKWLCDVEDEDDEESAVGDTDEAAVADAEKISDEAPVADEAKETEEPVEEKESATKEASGEDVKNEKADADAKKSEVEAAKAIAKAEKEKAKAAKDAVKAEKERLKLEAEKAKLEKQRQKEEAAAEKKRKKEAKNVKRARRNGYASIGASLLGTAGFFGGMVLGQGLIGVCAGIVVGAILGFIVGFSTEKND